MADNTAISWTDASWNPIHALDKETGKKGWFCTVASPGCEHCYASVLNVRLGTGHEFIMQNLRKHEFFLRALSQPLRWTRPRRIFTESMGDLFHPAVPRDITLAAIAAMLLSPHHIFQTLTKRAVEMRDMLNNFPYVEAEEALLKHAEPKDRPLFEKALESGKSARVDDPAYWWGVSAEDQRRWNERIPVLLDTRVRTRIISVEPLLSEIEGERELACRRLTKTRAMTHGETVSVLTTRGTVDENRLAPAIGWVIVGGESGRDFRPMNVGWARSMRDQCTADGVPFFFKQHSSLKPGSGDHLDGRKWHEFPDQAPWYEGTPLPVEASLLVTE